MPDQKAVLVGIVGALVIVRISREALEKEIYLPKPGQPVLAEAENFKE